MNTSHFKGRSAAQSAFTLIELLVVITIIAVLAGLLLPVVQKVLENARKVTAKTAETQIIAAVNSFQTEYGQYPTPLSAAAAAAPAATAKDITYGLDSTTPNQLLFDVLRNLEQNAPILNTRHIVYFESKNVRSATNPRDGFVPPGVTSATGNPNAKTPVSLVAGDLIDPWGNMYCVRIDANYTNVVKNPYSTATPSSDDSDDAANPPLATDTSVLRTGVISWSWGNDGIPASKGITPVAPYSPAPGDDVDSWQ